MEKGKKKLQSTKKKIQKGKMGVIAFMGWIYHITYMIYK